MALQSLLPHHTLKHVFACDSRLESKIWHEANFEVESWYDDVASKKFARKASYVDIFTAGFPCQPFSQQGLNGGEDEDAGRGRVAWEILGYLRKQKPKVLLLENVPGLLYRHPETLLNIMRELRSIKLDDGTPAYSISMKILDSRKFGAVPQHRPRLYIAGLLKPTRASRR